MKKKFLITLLALVCALCCALGLAACGDNGGENQGGKVTCTAMPVVNFVDKLVVRQNDSNVLVVNNVEWGQPVTQELEKGKECTITVTMKSWYDLGDLYIQIIKYAEVGTDTATEDLTLTRRVGEGGYADIVYGTCTYTPTGDFGIGLLGMATERTQIDVDYTKEDGGITVPLGHTEYHAATLTAGPNGYPFYSASLSIESADTSVATTRAWLPFPDDEEYCGYWSIEVTAVGIGTTTVTLTAETSRSSIETLTIAVTVVEPEHVESLTIDRTTLALDLEVDTDGYIYATFAPSRIELISWRSEDINVAIVSDSVWDGEGTLGFHVRAVGAGTTTFTVAAGDKTATCVVTVKAELDKVNGSAGFEYELNDWSYNVNTYNIIGLGTCSDTEIIIPNYYEGLRVVTIGSSVFTASNATRVSISYGIKKIDDTAFFGCASLKSITIPSSVTYIGGNAFAYCNSLESITFEGTIDEWERISERAGLSIDTGDYTVYCTDGTVAKDGTISRN